MKSRVSRLGSLVVMALRYWLEAMALAFTALLIWPKNRATPNRPQAAISAQDGPRGVLTPPNAPRGSQRVAIALQSYAGISGHAAVKPFSADAQKATKETKNSGFVPLVGFCSNSGRAAA